MTEQIAESNRAKPCQDNHVVIMEIWIASGASKNALIVRLNHNESLKTVVCAGGFCMAAVNIDSGQWESLVCKHRQ